jgi:cytochrome c-type biogenesis protein CcmF
MTAFGEITLCLAVLLAAAAILACIGAARFQSSKALTLARCAIAGIAVLFTAAFAGLLVSLLKSDFSLDYVAKFTERNLPVGYKLAAFWAGQEGSLLLWALLLAIMSTVAVFTLNRRQSIGHSAAAIGTLALVCGFFALLILLAADPFTASTDIPTDGNGLNPMLQDFGMIAHPPMLFLGYAGFTIPFALMVAALIAGRKDDQWLPSARRWALGSWLFLTIGILLGANWAYVELGWGGYWAWDPVENASLLPWLTATAFLHSLMLQQHRGMFRLWNAVLLAATFILCIFGTYLTRSGLVDSVHSFGQSLVGNLFLGFLAVLVVASAALLVWRHKALRPEHKLESLLGREGAFLATNMILSGITLVVLVGTIFPAITAAITGAKTTLGPPFYNKVVGPVGMLLVALMAAGPLLGYGKEAATRLKKGAIIPTIAAIITGAVVWIIGLHSAWAVACGAIAAAAVTTIVIELSRAVIARHENPLFALPRLLVSNHRRYGAQLTHLGIVLVLVGVTGSSVFSTKQTFQLNPGNSADFGTTKVSLDSIDQTKGPNYTVVAATVTAIDAAGRTTTLHPQRRFYDKWQDQPSSVVAIDSTWKRDLYMNLAGWDQDGHNVALEVIVNPLVAWLWIGGWLLAIGALICLTPRLDTLFARNLRETPMKAIKPSLATTVAAVACLFAVYTATLPARAAAQVAPAAQPALPAGHPDLSQIQGDAGTAALPAGHPGFDQVAGPSTQPAITGTLKIRTVQNTAGAKAAGADPVALELYYRGQIFDQTNTTLSNDGSLNVTELPVRLGIQPIVRVTHGGVVFSAAGEVMDPDHPTQNLSIPIYETTDQAPDFSITMRHVIIQPSPTGLDVMEMLAVNTPGDRAWTGNPDKTTLTLSLAPGVKDVHVGGGLDQSAVQVTDGKLVSHQALIPGEDRYQLQYSVAAKEGKAVLAITAPAKVGHVLVFIPDDGTTVTADGLKSMGSEQMDDKGTKTRYYMATSLEPGQTVTLTVAGLSAAAAPAPDVSETADASQPAPQATEQAGLAGSTLPKTVAAAGAAAMLLFGSLALLLKKPAQAAASIKVNTKGRRRGHR